MSTSPSHPPTDMMEDHAAEFECGDNIISSLDRDGPINDINIAEDEWGWRLQNEAVHPVPSFYPMDPRSTRKVNLENTHEEAAHSIEDISLRISKACQSLSIFGMWENNTSSATLSSMERVEMEVTFYLGDVTTDLIVELQRRKGCPIIFHKYRRCLLNASEGKFDPQAFNESDGLKKPLGRDRCNQPRASLGRPGLARPGLARPSLSKPGLSRPGAISRPSPGEGTGNIARPSLARPSSISRPSLGPLSPGEADSTSTPLPRADTNKNSSEKALEALNTASALLRKDRIGARQAGLESLVLLTDPLRTKMETAKSASHVVLLGTARVDYRKSQGDDIDALFDESAGLGIRETVLEMIMSNADDDEISDDSRGFKGIEQEFTDVLFSLCLVVLSNALDTVGESTKVASFVNDANSTFGCDVLSALIRIMGHADTNPHDAYYSACCLGVLLKGCGNEHKARALGELDAKGTITAALGVGIRSHAKLAVASRTAMTALMTDA